jgi:hypothetical protein
LSSRLKTLLTQKIACTCLVFKEPSAVWGLSQNIENG